MGAPHVAATGQLQTVEDGAEQRVQVGEALDAMAAAEAVVEFPVEHAIGEEVNEGVGLGIDVVAVQEHLGEIEDLLEPPDEGLDVRGQVGMGAQGVEVHAVGFERRVVAHPRERLRHDPESRVAALVRFVEHTRLIEKAEIGAFHVEAHGRHATLVGGKVLEDGPQQELDGARLRREPRDAGDIEMGRLGAEQEVGVEVDGRLQAGRGVQAHGDSGRRGALEIRLHAERTRHVRVGCQEHAAEGHRLQRLLGLLAQHRRGPEADLLAHRRALRGAGGIAIGTDYVVQGGREIGVRKPVRHHAEHHLSRFFDAHDRPDADRRLGGGPEVELVRSGGLELGRDDPPDRLGQARLNHDAARGTWGMRCGRKSRGARALRYVSTSWIG